MTPLRLVLVLPLALRLSEACSDTLTEEASEALLLRESMTESRCDALILSLPEAALIDALSYTILALRSSEAERLSDLLVLALAEALAMLPLSETDAESALTD
ncbi:MAG: hypothetical protein MR671_04700 [Clostridiales bacterium]|nr:hypothetical protein [Clostridiales bacterium]